MYDKGKRPPKLRTGDVQLHGNIWSHCHGTSSSTSAGARRSFQTLLSRKDIPSFGSGMCMHPGTVARSHDSVREYRAIAFRGGKLQGADDGDRFAASRCIVSGAELGEPYSTVFLHHDASRTFCLVSSLAV